MGVILLATLVKQCRITFIIRSITLVELLRSSGHIDESHIQFSGQLLHLITVVHRMIRGGNLLPRLQLSVDDGVKLIT